MKTFRVYYTDGNQRLFGADTKAELLAYLATTVDAENVEEIEEV